MIVHRRAKQLRHDVALVVFASVCLLASGLSAFGQPSATIEPANGKLASVIQLGEAIVKDTTSHSLSKSYVGNALNCTSCHLDSGKHPLAEHFWEQPLPIPRGHLGKSASLHSKTEFSTVSCEVATAPDRRWAAKFPSR